MNSKKILVAGDIMLDIYHFGQVNRISPEAPVPVFLETEKHRNVPGGAANVAVNIAAIGIETILFSATGSDENGNELISLLNDANVDTSNVKLIGGKRTCSKLRFIGQNNQQLLRVDTEDTDDIDTDLVIKEFNRICQSADGIGLILLSDYNKGFLTKDISQRLINLGRENGIPVLVDVKDKNIEKYKHAFLLKPNRKELADLTGLPVSTITDVEDASIKLCNNADVEYILTTLGADGMLLVNREKKLLFSKSMAREVFDVTGAGDTSVAYLAAELLLGKNIYDAIEIANYAAGVQVSKVGTSVVYPHEVEAIMSKEMNDFYKKQLNYYHENGMTPLLECKKQHKKIVFTNGCFDILHAGHVTYLKKAKRLGDVLVVGINTDASVKRLKGAERPINNIDARVLVLSALDFVDYVIPFDEDTPDELIKCVSPDVLVKGGDYNINEIAGRDIVESKGGLVITIPLVEGISTTNIVNRMRGK